VSSAHAVPSPIYAVGRWLCRVALEEFFPTAVSEEERVPSSGPCIIAANHASYLDPPAVVIASGRCTYSLARSTLSHRGLWHWLFRRLRTIPVDREGGNDLSSMREILRRLKEGHAVLLFPEGRRTEDGFPQPPKRGVGLLAAMAQVPLVPARIFGSFEAWGKGTGLPRPFRPLHVVFGAPILPSTYDPGPGVEDRHRKIVNLLMDRIFAIDLPADARECAKSVA
jgi:1-acyl-sn-glycerol-3-phosphate acyltransferase